MYTKCKVINPDAPYAHKLPPKAGWSGVGAYAFFFSQVSEFIIYLKFPKPISSPRTNTSPSFLDTIKLVPRCKSRQQYFKTDSNAWVAPSVCKIRLINVPSHGRSGMLLFLKRLPPDGWFCGATMEMTTWTAMSSARAPLLLLRPNSKLRPDSLVNANRRGPWPRS